MQVHPKTCCILPNMSKMFPTTMGILLIWTNLVNLSFTWSRNFPLSLLWCHNYIIHLILLVVKEISYLTKHILVKLWHWSSMHPHTCKIEPNQSHWRVLTKAKNEKRPAANGLDLAGTTLCPLARYLVEQHDHHLCLKHNYIIASRQYSQFP